MANNTLIVHYELFERLQKEEINFKTSAKARINHPYVETRLQTLQDLLSVIKTGYV